MSSVIGVGIQLIVFGGRETKDLGGVLEDCKKAGYDCIETTTPPPIFEVYSPRELKEACEKHELEYAGVHGAFEEFREEKNADRLIKNTLDAGASYLICSGVGKGKGLDGFREAVPIFSQVGKKCKEASLTFCYHNHSFEFGEFDGIKGIDFLGKETDPELVKFNIDVAWVYIGGEKPEEFIEKYRDRCGYYHFKDAIVKGNPPITTWDAVNRAVTWTELGKGQVNLKSAYEAAMRHNLEYIVYENDLAQGGILQDITESRGYLRSLGI